MSAISDWFWGGIGACATWPSRYPFVNGLLFGLLLSAPIWIGTIFVLATR